MNAPPALAPPPEAQRPSQAPRGFFVRFGTAVGYIINTFLAAARQSISLTLNTVLPAEHRAAGARRAGRGRAADGGILDRSGVVDFATGPVAPGVFVIARSDEPTVVDEMDYLGMGKGPYYSFYRPYHLASIEAPLSVPAAVLDGTSDIHPRAWRAEVAAGTKRPLRAGEAVDGIGGTCVYGMIDSAEAAREENLVPLGLLAGARLVRDVEADHILTYDDVEIDTSTTIAQLRALQDRLLAAEPASAVGPVPGVPKKRS